MKIGVAGGLPQTLCDLSVSSIVVGGSWNHDGVIIFGDAAGGIMRGSASGGPCQPLTRPERNESNHLFPVFLPDGKHFLYLRSELDEPHFTTDLYVGSLDAPPDNQKLKRVMKTGYSTVVLTPGSSASQLLFVRDAILFAQPFDPNLLEFTGEAAPLEGNIGNVDNDAYFSASMNGVLVYRTSDSNDHQLTWFDPQGQAISESGDPIFPRTLAVTRDGRQAAFESLADGSPTAVDLLRGTRSRLGY